jgi:hypothetical protein
VSRLYFRSLVMAVAACALPLAAQAPAVVTQAPVDPTDDIAFHAILLPRDIYVGQQATYQVGVFIAEDARARLRRNPEFIPPELRAMLGYDLSAPVTYTRMAGSRRYEVHVFQRAIFPLVAGRHAIAPARLSYSLPLSTSFFSREESRTLRAESLTVIARDAPPAPAGRPGDFTGAVGMLGIERRADTDRPQVGRPFVLTLSVRGVGNIALLPRPSVRLTWAQLVQGPERVQIDTSGPLVRGVKEFDYIVTPTTAGSQSVPALNYGYFDPYAQRYTSATVPDLALSVAQGTLVATRAQVGEGTEPLSIRRSYRGSLPPPISSYASYWLALAAAPIPAAGVAFVRRARRRAVRRKGYALHQLAARNRSAGEAAVRRALTTALADRLQVDAATLADPRRIVRALRRRGVTRDTAHQAAHLHAELDAAVFGGSQHTLDPAVAARAARIFDAIDREATHRRSSLGRLGDFASAFLLVAGASVAQASQAPSVDSQAFERGVALYQEGAYSSAQRIFAALAAAEPRAADAWANSGTSAWQAHDTAGAAVSWQRALRLDPLDAESRERLDMVPSFRSGMFGDVPPLPLSVVVWIGAVAWVAGWGLRPIGRRWSSIAATASLVLTGAALVVGVRLSEIAHGRQAAVVRSPERLRNGPSLGADLAEEVMLGETVRTPTSRGTWTFVRLGDGREGWLPTEGLVSLEVHD